MNQLSILKTQFIDKFQRLDTCQSQISEQLLDAEDVVQEYLDDMEDAENYRDRYIEMCTETLFLENETDLSALYDELEGKLRSLESSGRTQEKYGDFLAPLVESCLPEEILMVRKENGNTETDAIKGSRTLEHLMTFLRLEVQGEEMMVQLAKSGFGTPIRKKILQLRGLSRLN
ncbi:uncharacterized protein TNCV_3289061 [Trichonephila clavipes]|nr:uncharacterized protein TNCV_3289061 [Trichonephila clavipes]